jgi:tetratricopeptide (TPR) repeat protein
VNQRVANQLQQGFQLLQIERLPDAQLIFESILKLEPLNLHALNLLGVVFIQMQQAEKAIPLLERALTVNDKDAQTFSNLGLAYKDQHQFQDAEKAFNASLSLDSQQPQTLNNLGNVLAAQDQHKQAVLAFDAALKIDANYPECLSNFAQSLKELGNLEIALKAIDHANHLVPNNSYFLNVKGEIQLAKIDYYNARQTFNKAIAIDNYMPARINLSTALKQLGDYVNAKDELQSAIEHEPNNSEAHNHLGVLQEQLGEFNLAANSFRLALTHTPNHASSFYQLAKLKNQILRIEEVDKITELLSESSTPSVFKVSLFFALGVYYDKTKEYALAIKNYAYAQQIKAQKFPYNAKLTEQYRATVEGITLTTSADVSLAQIHSIFIIGMPRSGTSLAEQILASHSQVFGAGELGYINDLVKKAEQITNASYPYCLAKLSHSQRTEFGRQYKQRMLETFGNHSFFTDKNPLNFNFVGFIKAILPDAKFVYCKRNPTDNCLSIFKLPFDDSQGYAHDLHALGHYYREHERLMAFWTSMYSKDITTVVYEEVVNDQPRITAQLLEFLGLNYEKSTERFYQTQRLVMTPSAEQVRQPIYRTSVDSWQKYGDVLQPLLHSLEQHRVNKYRE